MSGAAGQEAIRFQSLLHAIVPQVIQIGLAIFPLVENEEFIVFMRREP
jgi:hypothetical protein